MAPLSVWCNWFAWSPVLSLGCSIAASYIINAVAPQPTATSPAVVQWLATNGAALQMADADKVTAAIAAVAPGIRSWTLFTTTLGPVSLSLNLAFFIGAALMLAVFAVQHRGILGTANVQKYIGLLVIIPMFIVGVVPLLIHGVNWENFSPLVPLAAPAAPAPGAWNITGWTLVLGSMFIAAWSTYGFETAICYTSEFRDPAKDTFKAIFYSGLLCLLLFTLVPFTFQSMLGVEGMLEASIVDGSGVAAALAHMVGGGPIVENFLVMLMILALVLCIMTAMAGSSRTLYQGSADGWLPRYLSHVNEHGAPTRAMWTDLVFNLAILAIACADATSFFFILAVSNCGYIIFNFLNLNSAWIHRIDSAHIPRPYRAPTCHPGARRRLRLRERDLHGRGRKGLEPGRPLGRPDHRRPDHPGLLLPPLCPGRRQVPGRDVRGPACRPRRCGKPPPGWNPALPDARRWRRGAPPLELVLPALIEPGCRGRRLRQPARGTRQSPPNQKTER